MQNSTKILLGALLGGALIAPASALADPDVRARVHIDSRPHAVVRVDRFHRVPPDVRVRGVPGRVTVRVNPFRAHLGWRVNRFTPRERALWTHGRWWHGRHGGRLGWWWWTGGGWYFYSAPAYPYPDYVSETYYDEPSANSGDYWYYCRDPEGYYPYVRSCHTSWEPVAAQPGGEDSNNDQYGDDDQTGPDQMGPDDQGPPDTYGSGDDQGPPDEDGPPDDGPPPR